MGKKESAECDPVNIKNIVKSTELFSATPTKPPVNVNRRLYNRDRMYRLVGKSYGKHARPVVNVNKVAAYKTELAKKRYVFPKPGEEAQEKDICQVDNRNILEVFRDVLGVIMDKYSKEDLEFLSRCVGYDVTIPQYSSSGVPMTQSLLNTLIREYKELNGFRNVSKCLEEFCNRVEVEAEEEEPPGSELSGKIYICELGEAQECVKFLADNMWLLQTAGRRRVYRKLKKKVHSGQTLRPGRLLDFCQEMRQKYYNEQSQVWAVPEPTPDNCPGQCFLAAHGKPLYFMRGWVKDEWGKDQEFQCLVDNGSTHDLLPVSYVRKHNIKLGTVRKRNNMHMFTAGAEIKNSIEGEVTLEVAIRTNDCQYQCVIPFLLVNDNLNIKKPVLGNPFLFDNNCEIYVRKGYIKGSLKCVNGDLVDVMLPRIDPADGLSVCDVLEGRAGSADDLPEVVMVSNGDQSLSSLGETITEEQISLEKLKATCLLAYGDTPADQVLTSLGGNTADVELEVRDSLDDAVFDRMDLLRVLKHGKDQQESRLPATTIPEKYMKQISGLIDKYPEAFSSEDRKIGTFKGYMYYPNLLPNSDAFQKKRDLDFSQYPAAVKKLNEMEKLGIIQVSDSQSTDFVHNLLLQHKKKPAEAGRHWTKADAYIQGRTAKLTDPDIKVRCINDLTTLNDCLESIPSITLPTETQVKNFVSNKMITLLDLKDMFYSIRICPTAYHFFNFYYLDTIYNLTRLAQGLGSSPYVATEALKSSLTEAVWKSFLSRNQGKLKLLRKFYNNYDKIQISFIDDMAIGSYPLCACTGQRCGDGFDCKTFDMDTSAQLHIEVVEAVVFAIHEAGFLIATDKFEPFVQDSFIFLGTHYKASSSEYGIALDRAQSILKFRVPRSLPELGSRLSTIFYSCPHLPAIRKLAMPLSKIIHQNKFVWKEREMMAYNNVKLAVSLSVSLLHIFDPDRYGVLVTDSSKHCASFCFYQISSQGLMIMVATETRVLSGNESRHVAVYRELMCLVWAIGQVEKYILATKKHVLIMGDAQSILFIRQAKSWIGKLGEIRVYLSKFQNITLTFVPGRFLALPDDFSRQFSSAFIHKPDAPLSRTMSDILPPIPPEILKKVHMMSGPELTEFLDSENSACKFDIWDKSEYVTQVFRESDIQALLRETQPLQIFLKWLRNPYDIDKLDMKATKEFFSVLTGSSKTKIDAWIKDMKLNHLQKALKTIDYNSSWRTVFGLNEKQSTVQTNMVTTRSAKKSSLTCITDPSLWDTFSENNIKCVHWEDIKMKTILSLEQLVEYCKKKDDWDKLIKGFKNVIGVISEINKNRSDRDRFIDSANKYLDGKCLVLKFALSKSIFIQLGNMNLAERAIRELTGQPIIMYCYESQDWTIIEQHDCLILMNLKEIRFDGLEAVKLEGWVSVLSDQMYLEQLWPSSSLIKVYMDVMELHVSVCKSLMLFNTDIETAVLPAKSQLFKISHNGKIERIWFGRLQTSKAKDLLSKVMNLSMETLTEKYCDALTDYMVQLHCCMIKPVFSEEKNDNSHLCQVNTLISKCPQVVGGTDNENKNFRKGNHYHNQHQLSVLLFAHRMRTNKGVVSKEDLISLQNSDGFLQSIKNKLLKQNEVTDNESTGLFVLENDILYRNTHMARFGVTFLCPAVPRFLCKQLILNLHSTYNLHIGAQEMYMLLRVSVYCKDLLSLVKQGRMQCPVCIYSHQTGRRKLFGEKLLWKTFPPEAGAFAQADLIFLAHNVYYNSSVLLTYVDCLTKYFTAIPIHSKAEQHVEKAFATIFSLIPPARVIQVDAGSEFVSARVRSFLESLGCEIYFSPSKNAQAIIENANRVFKSSLNSCIQKQNLSQNQWGGVLVQALNLMNARPPGRTSILSRHQLFFSPLHFIPQQFVGVEFPEDCNLPNLHRSHYRMLHEPTFRLKPRKGIHHPTLTKGKIVRNEVARVDQSGEHGNQLLPSTDRYLKIKKVLSGGNIAVAKDLLLGKKDKYSCAELRSLGQLDFPFPNSAIKPAFLSQIVPPVHGVEYARRAHKIEQPFAFGVEAASKKIDLKPRSILKIKSEQKHQPLRGRLISTVSEYAPRAGLDQLEAYFRAIDNVRWLRYYAEEKQETPDLEPWELALETQSDTYGVNISLHYPEVLPPVHSSHNRHVQFDKMCENNECRGLRPCQTETYTDICNTHCVSLREATLLQVCCLNCSFAVEDFQKRYDYAYLLESLQPITPEHEQNQNDQSSSELKNESVTIDH